MAIDAEIKQLKAEEQTAEERDPVCGPFCSTDGKYSISLCGLGFLLVGLAIFAGSWASYVLPIALIAAGFYVVVQARNRGRRVPVRHTSAE